MTLSNVKVYVLPERLLEVIVTAEPYQIVMPLYITPSENPVKILVPTPQVNCREGMYTAVLLDKVYEAAAFVMLVAVMD